MIWSILLYAFAAVGLLGTLAATALGAWVWRDGRQLRQSKRQYGSRRWK